MSLPFPQKNLLAFVADTQAPMFVETILLKPYRNRAATDMIFRDIARISPSAFFLLGDVVNLGYSDRQWRRVDPHLHAIRQQGVPIYGILGNHEVMGRPLLGQAKFQLRFPEHRKTGYSMRLDNIGIILLNSNFQTLSAAERKTQQEWFEACLQEWDQHAGIEFIITCCHHSPYTNSRIVKPSREVQEFFVPAFIESRKAQLFLSGHAHAFEHFQVKGKDFMVIGGGGGLKQPLRRGIGSLADLAEGYKPMFHYITVAVVSDHLEIISYHLRKDFSGFDEGQKHLVKKWTDIARSTG